MVLTHDCGAIESACFLRSHVPQALNRGLGKRWFQIYADATQGADQHLAFRLHAASAAEYPSAALELFDEGGTPLDAIGPPVFVAGQ